MERLKLGEMLVRRRAVAPEMLPRLLALQKQNGSRLGDIAIAEGALDYRTLHRALAEQQHLPFADLLLEPPDAGLLSAASAETYLRLRSMPWKRDGDSVLVAAAEFSDTVKTWMRKTYGDAARPVMTSPFDIRRAVEKQFRAPLEEESRLMLWRRRPDLSARTVLTPAQQQSLLGFVIVAIALMAWAPIRSALFLIMFCHIIYTFNMLFKCMVFAAGTAPNARRQQKHQALPADETLPVYTVLVPMYREAGSLPGMLEAMRALDYPASKLDIKLVLEADDEDTFAAAIRLKPRYHFDIIRVPPSEPRTKPKACNYALKFARGEYVTVFDADDRPERTQLKKAVQAFRSAPDDVVCLQARLNYYNANDNLLTRFFSLEYTTLFHFMLYGLERIGIPIPLGGTSNHMALKRLRDLGEWDPFNVTEDADLGTRLAARGLKTRMLDSYTMEEAPNRVMPWIRQRSRWIKGYMQTWLVHMRRPRQLWRALGAKGFFGFQCFIGLSCFAFLTAPVVWMLSLLWVAQLMELHQVYFPGWLAWMTAINLALNVLTHWGLSFYSASLYRWHILPMCLAALLYPFYLILHSIASYKAWWQLAFRPHFWEKTAHGLAQRINRLAFERDIVLMPRQ